MRIVYYVNQFFGGIGGEDKADQALIVKSGSVGPALAITRELGENAEIVLSLIAGDNYATEHPEDLVATVMREVEAAKPDVVIAGPAFNAGRYGMACGMVLSAIQERFGIPGVTAMSEDNPGVELYRQNTYIVRTGNSTAFMKEAVPAMARLARKLAAGEPTRSAAEEGYFPRGERRNVLTGRPSAVRAVDMAVSRGRGKPVVSELIVPDFEVILPPVAVSDLSRSTVALVTEGGVVPRGNPDRLETWNASHWFRYDIGGANELQRGAFEAWHGGYLTEWTDADPNRNVPVDAARALEREGVIGKLYDQYYVTCGNVGNIRTLTRIGKEMAEQLQSDGVSAVLLTAT
jgi:glycine reductase